MKSKNEDVSVIRRRVEKKFEERSGLLQHGIVYVAVNIMLWIIWLLTTGGFPWPLFVTVFWGIGMLSHLIDYYHNYGQGAQRREAQIDAEVERQLALERRDEWRGRDYDDDVEDADVYELDDYQARGLRLSDDGELIDLPEQDQPDQERGRQRQTR